MDYSYEDLQNLQAQSIDFKLQHCINMIAKFYHNENGKCYLSYSGGKDSTVLKWIIHTKAAKLFPELLNIPVVYFDTGLEYPEVKQFVKSDNNIIIRRPEINFFQCILKYGYPIISKEISQCICEARVCPGGAQDIRMHGEYINPHNGKVQFNHKKYLPLMELPIMFSNKCCNYLKKKPAKQYEKETGNYAITAEMAEESILRARSWIGTGCNAYSSNGAKRPKSKPMSIFTEQDVLGLIFDNHIEIPSVYGDIVLDENNNYYCIGCDRTGCAYCDYGVHLEKGETRFQRLAKTHPRQYEYSIGGGQWINNPNYDTTKIGTDYWNPKQIWVPDKDGLGMGKMFDMVNEVMGRDFIRYY